MQKNTKEVVFGHNTDDLIKSLDTPDYITYAFSDIGVESLAILRGVFRVDQSYLGGYFARVLSMDKSLSSGKEILDLGCGCGLLGLVCAQNGAKRVHFADVNPAAVKNSKINAILLDVEDATFSIGNLFENIPAGSKFDMIVFNPPSINGLPANHTEAAFIREDEVIFNFYRLFSDYLKPDGSVIMPGSSRFDGDLSPANMVRRYNLRYQELSREQEESGHHKYVLSFSQ